MRLQSVLATVVVASLLSSAVHAAPAAPATSPVQPKVHPFDLQHVRLLDGPFKDAQELDKAYLLSLDPERLLHAFRLTAKLPTSAEPLGGWEAPTIEIRGHFVGHYLTACALMYRSTGDEQFKQRADHLVTELARCQEALGGKYLAAFPESFFDRLEAGQRVWVPYYTIHKIMAGLLDANQLCGNAQALDVVNRMADYFKGRTDKLSDEQMAVVMKTEFGGMNEVFADLYAVTNNPDHLEMARRFDHRAVTEPLAQRQDKLAGLHANTQIPKITGAARIYELTGEERMRTVADFFWSQVALNRSLVSGGNSYGEHFRKLGVEAGELTPTTAETCNTYNMLKLTRHLFSWDPSAEHADYYERGLFNQILGSIEPQQGGMIYFLSHKPGHFKVYNTPTDSFWCCTGTGVENHAKYGDSIYFRDDRTLWVNQFIASELTWPEAGLVVRQETRFPEQEGTTLRLKADRPVTGAMKIRVPYWATRGVTIKINGQAQDVAATPKSYVTLDRTWNDGDVVEVAMPMSLHLHRAADLPDRVAILYGPVVLAGRLGREQYPSSDFVRDQNDLNHTPTPRVPVLVSDDANPSAWLKPVEGKPLTFATTGVAKPAEVTFAPLYSIHHERYSVYWELMPPQKWSEQERRWREQDEARRAEEARIVDDAHFGEQQPERDHNVQSEKSNAGQFHGRFYRDATAGGFFSAELKVDPNAKNILRCTYWGSDDRRQFEILVDGRQIATQSLTRTRETRDRFITADYPLPQEATSGKQKVTVRFQPVGNSTAGGVFGCRMLRAETK